LHFLIPVIRGWMGEIPKSVFRLIISTPGACLDFRPVAPFRKQSASKARSGKSRQNVTRVKITRLANSMSEFPSET